MFKVIFQNKESVETNRFVIQIFGFKFYIYVLCVVYLAPIIVAIYHLY